MKNVGNLPAAANVAIESDRSALAQATGKPVSPDIDMLLSIPETNPSERSCAVKTHGRRLPPPNGSSIVSTTPSMPESLPISIVTEIRKPSFH